MPSQRHKAFCGDIDIRLGLDPVPSASWSTRLAALSITSTVSSTLITPGCRKVRSFLRAFFARGKRARLAVMSKEKMLQLDPSSCHPHQLLETGAAWSFCV